MGKAEIVTDLGQGEYIVEIKYNRVHAQRLIIGIANKLAEYQTKLAAATDEDEKTNIKIAILSLEKRLDFIENNVPEDYQTTVWCADYTEGITGTVGTCEVPGEVGTILIYPGYLNGAGAVWDQDRDGQLMPTLAMQPIQAWFNLAVLPGWQKWQPLYRFGTITEKNGDFAHVELESIPSSQQSIGINKYQNLYDVPIDYMQCDGGAFETGDEVLIRFINQDWEQPEIIGFKEEPESCGAAILIVYGDGEERLNIALTGDPLVEFTDSETVTCADGGNGTNSKASISYLYGTYTLCRESTITGDASGAEATIMDCIDDYFQRKYSFKEIFAASIENFPYWLEIESPYDQYPVSYKPCFPHTITGNNWSKVYDEFVVLAFIHYPDGPLGDPYWSVAITFHNDPVTWLPYGTDMFPTGGYQYNVCKYSAACSEAHHFTDTHVGFDIWKDGTDFYVGIIADQNQTLRIFKFNSETLNMDLQDSYISVVRDAILGDPGDAPFAWMRLIGYGYTGGDHLAYWCELGRDSKYYIENLVTGSYQTVDLADTDSAAGNQGVIETGIWNPISRTAHFVTTSTGGETVDSFDDHWEELHQVSFYRVGSLHTYNPDGSPLSNPTDPHLSFNWHAKDYPGLPDYDIQCTDRPANPDYDGAHGSPWAFINYSQYNITKSTREYGNTINRGRFYVDGSEWDQGTYDSFYHTTNYYQWVLSMLIDLYCTQASPGSSWSGAWSGGNCNPEDAKDYEFLSGVFDGSSIAYNYRQVDIVTVVTCATQGAGDGEKFTCIQKCAEWNEDCGGDPCYKQFPAAGECDCNERDWEYQDHGDTDVLRAADPVFPHDRGWKSILLHGVGRANDEAVISDVEHTNLVIYKDMETGELFVIGGPSGTIGVYERAFFKVMGT